MPDPSALYATDEDIAVRDPGNFAELVPADQMIATGTDGVIASGSHWTLTSATASFLAAGVARGHVVAIEPASSATPAHYAIESATATTLTLRRIGTKLAAPGQPPATGTALVYSVATFGPQIEDAAYDLNRRYGIDDNFAAHSAAYLYEARTFRQAVILTVLIRVYTSMARTKDGDWSDKRGRATADLEDLLARLTVKWGSLGSGQPPTTRFSATITR